MKAIKEKKLCDKNDEKSVNSTENEKVVGSTNISMDSQEKNTTFKNPFNESTAVTLQLIQTCNQPYSEEYDKKIISYFKGNMNLLKMKDDLLIYHVMKAKYSFQKSAKSLQARFLNVILPNLFKYNIMNHSDLIDFYDAAKLELPEEFINILSISKPPNENDQNTSNSMDKNDTTNKNTEDETEQISEDMCLKMILDFVLLKNSDGISVFIPDTEPNIPLIKNRLLTEFDIKTECIKIISKNRFDVIIKLKEAFDKYDEFVFDVLKNHIHDEKFVERMLPDAKKLFEYLTSFKENQSNLLNENQIPINNETPTFEDSIVNDTLGLSEIISNLSDSFDNVTISPNTIHVEQIKNENIDPDDQDEVETIVRSPYFDHTYSRNDADSLDFFNIDIDHLSQVDYINNLELNFSENDLKTQGNSIIDHACTPQIMFSKRCQAKIQNEHINVNHLLLRSTSDNGETSQLDKCNEEITTSNM